MLGDAWEDSSPMKNNSIDVAPEDKGQVAFFIMLLLGAGSLFPWNIFINASTYFSNRFCGTYFENVYENYFSISYTLSQTVGLALSVLYQEHFTYSTKIVYPLLLYSGVFGLTTVFVLINIQASLLFWLTFMSTCICGLLTASLSGGLFGLGGKLPPKYTGALMTGQGLAGLIVSISGIITTLGSPKTSCTNDDPNDDSNCEFKKDYGAFSYFGISTFILITCVVGFVVLRKLPFTRYYIGLDQVVRNMTSSPLLDNSVINGNTNSIQDKQLYQTINITCNDSTDEIASQIDEPNGITYERLWRVFNSIKSVALSVMLTFVITIGLFPSLTVNINSTQKCVSSNIFYNDLFTPFLFLMFNLFDFIGRFTAGSIGIIFNESTIVYAAIGRIIFFPLFLLCNVSNTQLPIIFNNDSYPIIIMMLFSFTNGYVATSCMVMGPSLVNKNDNALSGTTMIFFLTMGLLLGASTSFLTVFISSGTV